MSKRGENIYKRKDGRWEGRYIKGRKVDGKIQYGYIYSNSYKTTQHKLIEKKYLYRANQKDRLLYSGSVRQWLTHWLNNEIKPRVKVSSFASYHYKIEDYILPSLGDCPLVSLTPESINSLINFLQERKLSVNTIKVILTIFKQGMSAALKADLIMDCPFKDIQIPTEKKVKVSALSREVQKKVEDRAIKDDYGLPTFLALYTGMRIGEISALQWADIDFERDAILVRHTYQRLPLGQGKHKTQLSLSKAKSTSSQRMIPLAKSVKKKLLNLKTRQTDNLFVFENKGLPIEPRLLTYHFKKITREIGIEDIHFHQLRHTFATRCLEAQENIAVISAILGHHSVKTTLDIYTDALTFEKRLMIQKMEDNWLIVE
ncbi:site-specific integrase [Lactococcus piscium]|uniref:Site-specific integrase n=1 Tax=Pseudolactococcus paracarnosus TaxID=2749962 RepID=A0A7L4WGV6_9LACT|nr:site-specific integrase [Lactococcus paracarnosus]MCJ1993755.1 site-specific integrase [Lactococcus paracarnosus]QDJ28585.1 hypothetical protein BHS01_08635 [Lactococcus paracarnosus]SPC38159.1 conserved hypothetical protein [Lactococcus piscium]